LGKRKNHLSPYYAQTGLIKAKKASWTQHNPKIMRKKLKKKEVEAEYAHIYINII